MNDVKKPASAAPATAPKAPEDDRLRRPDRDAPHSDRRPGEGREFTNRDWEVANQPTDPERRRAFREKWSQTLLPNLPKKDGWHRCWVSATHPSDTPARRLALGYRFIKVDEIREEAGWAPQADSVKDGDQQGVVAWREMRGMECPQELYIQVMKEFHHDQPLDMMRDIIGGLDQAGDEARQRGGRVDLDEGFREAVRFRRAPAQFE